MRDGFVRSDPNVGKSEASPHVSLDSPHRQDTKAQVVSVTVHMHYEETHRREIQKIAIIKHKNFSSCSFTPSSLQTGSIVNRQN